MHQTTTSSVTDHKEDRMPTHFSAKARCTQDPDEQICPLRSELSGTLSTKETNKYKVSGMERNWEFVKPDAHRHTLYQLDRKQSMT